jgi:mitogen-activated protein kinase organizer 1
MSGQIIRKFLAHNHRINCLALNPYQNVICSGSYDNTVKLWDLQSRNHKPMQVLDDFKDSVTKIIVTDDSIIAGSVDGVLRTYDLRMGKLVRDSINRKYNNSLFIH